MKRWIKTSHGVIFCLSNQIVQVYFKDSTELFVDMAKKLVTYLNKQGEVTTIHSANARKAPDADLRKRLSYIKEILSS